MSKVKEDVSPRTIKLIAHTRYDEKNDRLHVRVNVAGEFHIMQGGTLEVRLMHTMYLPHKICGVKRISNIQSSPLEEVLFSMKNVPYGGCGLKAWFTDRYGTPFATELLYEKYNADDVLWKDVAKDCTKRSSKVLLPWDDLVLSGANGRLTVKCSLREYEFGSGAFFAGVKAAGESLLSAPMRLTAQVNGREIGWNYGKMQVIGQDPDLIVLQQTISSEDGHLVVKFRFEIEFDGMIRVDFALEPKKQGRLERLFLEIPIAGEAAKYLYYFPWESGNVNVLNATALSRNKVQMSFRPYVWLGDEDRGMAWFAESDQDWYQHDINKAVEIEPEQDKVVLRLNIISRPVKLVPDSKTAGISKGVGKEPEPQVARLRYTFGFQATPVKPKGLDAWDYRTFFITAPTFGFKPRLGAKVKLLDQLVKSGIRTVVLLSIGPMRKVTLIPRIKML